MLLFQCFDIDMSSQTLLNQLNVTQAFYSNKIKKIKINFEIILFKIIITLVLIGS